MTKTRNKFETRIFKELSLAEVVFTYETERIPYILARHYIPDFIIQTPLGKIYVECKGYLRQEDKSKMVAVKKLNPKLDIRILFYAYNKKYKKWAEKVGIRWAVGTIPKEWLNGF